jgi:hypothetical protein
MGSSSPVSSFVVAVGSGTTRNRERVPTAQQGASPGFRPLLIKPHSQCAAFELPGRPRPGAGCYAGGRRPSCVSRHRFRTGHVAIGVTQGLVAVCPRLPPEHSFHGRSAHDFWGPNVEAPPYPPVTSVCGWARLLSELLASPRGPFMVELFIAAGFSRSRRAGQARSDPSPDSELPTPAGLNEVRDPRAPRTGLRCLRSLTRFNGGGSAALCAAKSVRIAHSSEGAAFLFRRPVARECRFAEKERRAAIGSNVGITLDRLRRTVPAAAAKDYSDKPPSNRTSTSRCIRLYGSVARREAIPAPLAQKVNLGLPGATAHLSCVSHVPLSRAMFAPGLPRESVSRG